MHQRWRTAPPILAYDDADIRVIFQPGGSDFLLVTFGDALALADGMRFAADALVRKHGFAGLGFMAHQANWFPAEAIARALPHIAYTLRSFRRILTYGSSMGAYAAIKHAAALGATDVLALGPQWSIDPAECTFDSGYRDYYQPRMAGMGIRARDLAGRIAVLHDPGHAQDRCHVNAIAALGPSVTPINVPSAGHHLAPMLAGADFSAGLMHAWLRHDTPAFQRMLAERRRSSPIRIHVLLARAVLRHPLLALAAVEQLARSGRVGLAEADPHLLPLLRSLITQGRVSLATRVADLAEASLTPLRARILRDDLASPGAVMIVEPSVRTAHGTTVFYDSVTGTLRHHATPAPACEAFGLHPATLAPNAPENMPLTVSIHGATMVCVRGKSGRLELAIPLPAAACVRVTRPDKAGFALALGPNYLCASPGGKVLCDRTEVNAWEIFHLV